MKEHFVVDLEAVATAGNVPPADRLAVALEELCAEHGFRCLAIERKAWGRDRSGTNPAPDSRRPNR